MQEHSVISAKEVNKAANISLRQYAQIVQIGKGQRYGQLNRLLGNEGNKKVPASTAIFNMGAATDCPSRKLGLCAACKAGVKCYALKTELPYHPMVLPYRRRQEAFWKGVTAQEFVSQFLLLNSIKIRPFNALRISEAGDFHSQACIEKAEKIAFYLKRFGVHTYCYTSRSDLDFSACKNLIVSGSGFTKKGVSNIFKIIHSKKDKPKGWSICRGNCRVCQRCIVRGQKICVLAH